MWESNSARDRLNFKAAPVTQYSTELMRQRTYPPLDSMTSDAGSFLEQPRSTPRVVLEGSRLWTLLAVLILAPWLYIFLSRGGSHPSSEAPDKPNAILTTFPSAPGESAGPWGRVKTLDIVVSPALEHVSASTSPDGNIDWHFPGSAGEVAQVLLALGLQESTRKEILGLAKPDEATGGVKVTPTDELIWNLTPLERGNLYHALALHPNNIAQANAFRFRGTLEEWFAGSGIAGETLTFVEKLHYRHRQSVFLADVAAIARRVSPREQARFLKAAAGERTLIMKLRVGPEDNIDELMEYWSRGRRSKDVRPILESLAKVSGGDTIDVAHLLPGFARLRLYTYPTPATVAASNWHCHWTAMNFFSTTPDDRFADVNAVVEELKVNYYPIYRNPALGDIVIFLDQAGELFHSAVYIADDVVFTKNGSSFSRPWIYMRMDQMTEYYPQLSKVQVSLYRRKDL